MVDNMAKIEAYTEEWDEMAWLGLAMEEVTLSFKIVEWTSFRSMSRCSRTLPFGNGHHWAEEHKIMCCVQKVGRNEAHYNS